MDLSRASLVDSTVIGALAAAAADKDATPLTLVAPANYVGTRLVELVGIGSRIPAFRTRAEAVTAHLRDQHGEIIPDVVDHEGRVARETMPDGH